MKILSDTLSFTKKNCEVLKHLPDLNEKRMPSRESI